MAAASLWQSIKISGCNMHTGDLHEKGHWVGVIRVCAGRDCKDKVREVAGEGLMRLVRFLDPMYSDRGERLRSKAALTLAHLATDNEPNATAIMRLGGFAARPNCSSPSLFLWWTVVVPVTLC